MALIDGLRNVQTGGGEDQEAVLIHDHIAVVPQKAHGAADTGLGESQVLRHINGAYRPFFAQSQDGLQIVLRRSMDFHFISPSFPRRMSGGDGCYTIWVIVA